MTAKTDDLEAVRVLADTLQPFTSEDRERIIRWAREKLGMATAPVAAALPRVGDATTIQEPPDAATPSAQPAVDIKKFVNEKAPRSDVHFAATVAYYHQFKAPGRKDSITKEDLIEACRQVDRKRPKVPAQVLVNAYCRVFGLRPKRPERRAAPGGRVSIARQRDRGAICPGRCLHFPLR